MPLRHAIEHVGVYARRQWQEAWSAVSGEAFEMRGGSVHDESSRAHAAASPGLQRAIVLALLDADDSRTLSCSELGLELGAPVAAVEQAVASLRAEGVLCWRAERASASPAACLLDQLGLIAI